MKAPVPRSVEASPIKRTLPEGLGIYLFAAGAIATGVIDCIWGSFDLTHEPIQAWGDRFANVHLFAYVVAIAVILGGLGILTRRTTRAGGIVLAIVYSLFAIFWLPRFLNAPPIIGYTAQTYVGILAGFCSEAIVVAAAIIVACYAAQDRSPPSERFVTAMRWVFGVCSITFGTNHLLGLANIGSEIPSYVPLGANFWTIFTGICFILAGIAFIIGILDVFAAWMLGAMFLVFSVVMLIPGLAGSLHDHASWGGNAYELVVASAPWIFAALLRSTRV